MAEKFDGDVKLSPKELAAQLRKPTGDTGKEVGLQMNKGNKHICLNSYKVLKPSKGDAILEIGMGNGFFIKDLFEMVDDLTYVGVDFSKDMVQEASALNRAFVNSRKVEFYEASIEKLPFDDNSFDCITTTNTLYFWPQPEDNAKELLRVLKPNGKLLVAYRSKKLMEQIELSKFGFKKYEAINVENLLTQVGFNKIITQVIEEPELDFNGKVLKMEGVYTIAYKA